MGEETEGKNGQKWLHLRWPCLSPVCGVGGGARCLFSGFRPPASPFVVFTASWSSRTQVPSIIGAVLQLGRCFDLLNEAVTAIWLGLSTTLIIMMAGSPTPEEIAEKLAKPSPAGLARPLTSASRNWFASVGSTPVARSPGSLGARQSRSPTMRAGAATAAAASQERAPDNHLPADGGRNGPSHRLTLPICSRLRRSLRALDRLSQRPVVNRAAAIVCISESGDHPRNDRLSMVASRSFALARIKMAIVGS
jgi:hypothetical protein